MQLAVAAAVLAFLAPGDRAAATYAGGALALTLHYEMTCGEPGPGPLVVEVPAAFRLKDVAVAGRHSSVRGHTVTIAIPGPTGVTCMSIAEGTLRVRLTGVHAPPGSYTVKAQIHRHAFATRLRIS